MTNQLTIVSSELTNAPTPGEPAPAHFVDRAALTRPLLASLVGPWTAAAGRPSVFAIYGMGGIGKTTLARWLLWRPEVEARFPDGRIWITLGREPPEAASALAGVLRQFRPDILTNITLADARARLAAMLGDKSVLVVIDDVWPGASAETARALIVAAPHTRFLLTTRFSRIANDPGLSASGFPVDEMTDLEACSLVEGSLGRAIADNERNAVQRLTVMVQGHPLALDLAAGRINAGSSWSALLNDLAHERSRLDALDEANDDLLAPGFSTSDRQRGVRASLTMSVRLLSIKGRELFCLLGVLDEDAVIGPSVAATVWSIGEDRAHQHLEALADAGLLKRSDDRYRMHDLLRDLSIELSSAPLAPVRPGDLPGLSLAPGQAASGLVERYRKQTVDGAWHTLPDDGYVHDHLVRLLEQADATRDIERLLWEEDGGQQCGWYAARESRGQIEGFINDVKRLQVYADRAGASGAAPAVAVTLQAHCALLLASINSLSRSAAGEVFAGAVRCGLMALPVAVALARREADTPSRARNLVLLAREAAPAERPALLHEVAVLASSIAPLSHRVGLLADIFELSDGDRRAEAMESLQVCAGGGEATPEEVRALIRVAADATPQQRQALLQAALATARGLDGRERAGVLATIAMALPTAEQPTVLAEAMADANTAETPEDQVHALMSIAEWLPADLRRSIVQQALPMARSIDQSSKRARALAEIASRSQYAERACLLDEALALAESVRGPARDVTLIDVAAHCPPERAVATIAPLNLMATLNSPYALPNAIASLPTLQALDAARRITYDLSKGLALALIAEQVPIAEQAAIIREALTTTHIGDGQAVSDALVALAKSLPTGPALTVARDIGEQGQRYNATAEAVARMDTLPGLVLAVGIDDQWWRGWAVTELVKRLATDSSADTLEKVTEAVHSIQHAGWRACGLAELAHYLPPSAKTAALENALNLARAVPHDDQAARFVAAVGWRLPSEERLAVVEEALAIAHACAHPNWERGTILRTIAADATVEQAYTIGLNVCQGAGSDNSWGLFCGSPFAILAQRLPPELTVELSRHVPDPRWQAKVMAEAAAKLLEAPSAAALKEALSIARSVSYGRDRLDAIADVAQFLEPQEALAVAQAMYTKSAGDGGFDMDFLWGSEIQGRALASVAPRLPVEQGLAVARAIGDRRWRACALATLAAGLPFPTRLGLFNEALILACGLSPYQNRASAIAGVALELSRVASVDLLHSSWTSLVRSLANLRRVDCTPDIVAAVPIVAAFAGDDAIAGFAQSLTAVGAWFP